MPGIFGNWFGSSSSAEDVGRADYSRFLELEMERERRRREEAEQQYRAMCLQQESLYTQRLWDNLQQLEPVRRPVPDPEPLRFSENRHPVDVEPARPTTPTSFRLQYDWREDFLRMASIPGSTFTIRGSSSRPARSTYKKPKKIGKRDRLY